MLYTCDTDGAFDFPAVCGEFLECTRQTFSNKTASIFFFSFLASQKSWDFTKAFSRLITLCGLSKSRSKIYPDLKFIYNVT